MQSKRIPEMTEQVSFNGARLHPATLKGNLGDAPLSPKQKTLPK